MFVDKKQFDFSYPVFYPTRNPFLWFQTKISDIDLKLSTVE